MLSNGLTHVDQSVSNANAIVAAFAVDDGVPVHQVVIAVEQARMEVELAMQIRNRLLEVLHYTPTRDKVFETPIVIVTPCV